MTIADFLEILPGELKRQLTMELAWQFLYKSLLHTTQTDRSADFQRKKLDQVS